MTEHTGLSGDFKAAQDHAAPQRGKPRKVPPPPFSLRLTFEERARLEQEAGDMALGAYIRSRVFDDSRPVRRRRRGRHRKPLQDQQAIARLLAELGRARLANNLNQLAKAANMGSLHVTADVEKALRDACVDILWMRKTLLRALGLKAEAP